MEKNNNFQENFAPAIVLVCICLVMTFALAMTYKVANPKYPKKVTAKTVTITAVAAPQEESGDQ